MGNEISPSLSHPLPSNSLNLNKALDFCRNFSSLILKTREIKLDQLNTQSENFRHLEFSPDLVDGSLFFLIGNEGCCNTLIVKMDAAWTSNQKAAVGWAGYQDNIEVQGLNLIVNAEGALTSNQKAAGLNLIVNAEGALQAEVIGVLEVARWAGAI
ncbi:hypothetical protein RND81_12G150800 [Saponaria officinalis]|uniref:Uncharacterized protein n=1 Tax=Saponaria officinalis TaxID=3572 RepID=A0AAW1HAX2_SAPOF